MAQQTTAIHPLLAHIRERGYWRVVIRPARFNFEHIKDIAALYPLVEDLAVRLRVWEFPLAGSIEKIRIGNDWIEQAYEINHHLEYWRFYQSGQLLDYAGFDDDWRGRPSRFTIPTGWQHMESIPVYDTLYRFTEIFEFAARLALAEHFNAGSHLHIEVLLRGLHGRKLYNDSERTLFVANRPIEIGEFERKFDLPLAEAIAGARKLALKTAEELFYTFKWQPTPGILQAIQDEFVRA